MDNTTLQKTFTEMRESTIEKKIAKVRKIANQIYEKNGELVAKDLIDEARPKNSIIHDCFPWDDKQVAEKARLWLANQYIARVRVRFISDSDEQENSQRVFRSVKVSYIDKGETKERQVYKRIDDIITQEQLRKQVVADLLTRQEYWTQEAKDFAELKSIVNQSELQRIKA